MTEIPQDARVPTDNDADEQATGDRDRARAINAAGLCLHIVANVAHYRAGWRQTDEASVPRLRDLDFWRRVNANAIDVAALHWCKLFADDRSRHCWQRVIDSGEHTRVAAALYELRGGEDQYAHEMNRIRAYRDKYLAHLDDETELFNPTTEIMQSSATLGCCRFQRHLVKVEFGTGGGRWRRGGSSAGSTSSRR